MVATVAKDTAGSSWQTGNIRQYDVWGSVRQGTSTGDPKGRYCANLGHVQDDESGLVYMRARYYEPSTGRFMSQDLVMTGSNWYAYCANDPVNFTDESGYAHSPLVIGMLTSLFAFGQFFTSVGALMVFTCWDPVEISMGYSFITTGTVLMTIGLVLGESANLGNVLASGALLIVGEIFANFAKYFHLKEMCEGGNKLSKGGGPLAMFVLAHTLSYNCMVFAYLMAIGLEAELSL